MALIDIKEVSKWYGKEVRALNNVNFRIESGSIFGLLGPNGAGKTTLIKILAGLITDFTGKININDISLPSRKIADMLGYMPQNYALYMELSVKENLDFFGGIYGMKNKSIRKKQIDKLLNILGLESKRDTVLNHLSGGMKQRVSLGCALVHNPKILLLDEPTIGLDPKLRLEFWNYFKELAESGSTILITTHVFDEAKYCSNLAFIKNGNLIAKGTKEEILKETGKEEVEQAYLYYMNHNVDYSNNNNDIKQGVYK